MAKWGTVRDPLWGELRWHPAFREWMGRIDLTPKHSVAFSLYDPPELEESQTWEEALAPVHAAYLAHLPREWEFRLAAASALIQDGKVAGPVEEAARHLRLDSIMMYAHGAGQWDYRFQGVGDMKAFPLMVEVSEEGVYVHF
jgi:hypothetical protein